MAPNNGLSNAKPKNAYSNDSKCNGRTTYERFSFLFERSKDIISEKHPSVGAIRRAMIRLSVYQDCTSSSGDTSTSSYSECEKLDL